MRSACAWLGPTSPGAHAVDPLTLTLLILTLLAALAAAIGAWRGGRGGAVDAQALEGLERRLTEGLERLREGLAKALREELQALAEAQRDLGLKLSGGMEKIQSETKTAIGDRFQGVQERIQQHLDGMRKDNEEKLEKIRGTVEEKLQSTLEKRLGESFQRVSQQLEQVHKGLGEMQALAQGVGDLKRVLTNVRSRGTFGEVQLAALLEQIMAPSQYASNVVIKPGSREQVEFAIRLPGREEGEGEVLLPIDSKFPQEDYLRLVEALEQGDRDAADAARRALRQRLLAEAARIREKYIDPPRTTDFALMFLPTEGLYAEMLRIDGLAEELQTRHRVMPTGPTTLGALLNSLQMGFRTLAIERRSSEVWRVLGAVKTEFGKFGEVLDGVKRNLDIARRKLDQTDARSRQMARRLREVEQLPEAEAASLLPSGPVEPDEEEEEGENSDPGP
ncbi:DNA recombination protein RmuC [Candidatus Sumerlaeota bacterium]|nr:DNA recombination protein RmuC [Candidatus Sumerlaeota bacterium]